MANSHRGEISAYLDGHAYTLCLTLGALAELEESLGGEDILSLARRFESGRISAREAICVIGAGLRGGGHDVSDDQVARMRLPGGVPAYIELVIDLLHAAFGVSEGPPEVSGDGSPEAEQAPFPGGV